MRRRITLAVTMLGLAVGTLAFTPQAGAQEALRHARSHLQARTRVFEEAVTSQLNY